MAKKKQVNLDFPLYKYLFQFYLENRGAVQRRYKRLSLKLIHYNEEKGFLRRPQQQALEMYIFLKEFCSNKQVSQVLSDFYYARGDFENRKEDNLSDLQNGLFGNIDVTNFETVIKNMINTSHLYSNYIFALTMGTGKTILMATCIFYEFILANKWPKDDRFCHNALVFAPDKTVLQSLREIETFDMGQVIPPEYVNWLDTNLKFHFLDDPGMTLSILDYSEFNIIVSNTQKIILKKQHKEPTAADLFYSGMPKTPEKSAFSQVKDLYNMDLLYEDEAYLKSNQRFEKLRRVKQLGIYVDEAHHAFGKQLEKDLEKADKNSLRWTIDILARKLEESGTKIVGCYNYTGTPFVKNRILPEVVYSFGLRDAITSNYLKQVELHSYENPTSREFLKIIIEDFWRKYQTNRYEGMLPKMAIFASRIDEIEEELRPLVEEILTELNISTDKILVNVGNTKLTSNDDIREFINLDSERSNKQFILLVNKGKEGWNCRSLFGVGMYRKPKSKIFVLQATMRCMRAITEIQHTATVYLSDENYHILENELSENFHVTVDDLQKKSEKEAYKVKLVPPPVKIKLKRIKKMFNLIEKDISGPVDLELATADTSRYSIKETIQDGIDKDKKLLDSYDLSYVKERRSFSDITLVAEIARYLNKSCILIRKILAESKEGLEKILFYVNDFNELVYDWIIPRLFHELYDLEEYENKKEIEIELTKDPGEAGYTVMAKPELVVSVNDSIHSEYKERSFHLDTYCFDSAPEKELFWNLLQDSSIEKVYFTGMITNAKNNFYIKYVDPVTSSLRTYFPDFVLQKSDNEWVIVEVKADFMIDDPVVKAKMESASQLAQASNWEYKIIPSTRAGEVGIV